jgi:hypothetical protein
MTPLARCAPRHTPERVAWGPPRGRWSSARPAAARCRLMPPDAAFVRGAVLQLVQAVETCRSPTEATSASRSSDPAGAPTPSNMPCALAALLLRRACTSTSAQASGESAGPRSIAMSFPPRHCRIFSRVARSHVLTMTCARGDTAVETDRSLLHPVHPKPHRLCRARHVVPAPRRAQLDRVRWRV